MKPKFLLLLCIATLGLASCKKDNYVDLPLPNQTIETVINPSQWQSIENNTRLTTTISFPEIDNATFINDGIQVAIYPDNNIQEYTPLPLTFDGQAYSYSVKPGSITIDIQTSDGQDLTPSRPTTPIGLRLVIITSNKD
jgi:hypothetical protein